MSEFSSKVIIITAAYGSIMRATGKAFAKHGAILSISGRNEEKLAKAAEEFKEAGAKEVLAIQASLNNVEDLDRIINETVNKFGKIDVLVNCVGGSALFASLHTFTPELFDEAFNLHVKAPALLIQKAASHLEKTKGNVINVSGILSNVNTESFALLGALVNAAKDKLAKMAALELAPKGIRVNNVSPGFCETTDEMPEQVKNMFIEKAGTQPLGQKLVKFDEVASSILFLASESANVITGEILILDRGRVLRG